MVKVIRSFKTSGSCTWKPTSSGSYTLYVRIKDDYGNIVTKELPYTISNKKTVKKNVTATINNITYKVTKAGTSGKAQVTVLKLKKKSLKSVTIPATVTVKGVKCNVVSISSAKIKSIGKNAIRNIHKKAVIQVPKGKQKAYKKLFNSKTGYRKAMKINIRG